MNISEPCIRRPIGTTLLALALFLVGSVAYAFLPVASLPAIDFPVIAVFTSRPGADPASMAASVAAPIERRLSSISGLSELTSSSSLGGSQIIAQFDIQRSLDGAARDVQAAINAAITDLPGDLPVLPFFRKMNSSGMPVLVLALTSDTLPTSAIFDATDTVIAQRISQIPGVAEARIAGAEQPAIRVQLDPGRLAATGLGLTDVAAAINAANAHSPVGAFSGDTRSFTLATNDQLSTPEDFREIVIAARGGAVVKLRDVAKVELGVRNRMAAGWFNGKPAVLVIVAKQPGANVVETVDQVKAMLPQMQQWIPKGIDISILSDRTQTIRASIHDIQRTMLISVSLVMAVVYLFLRRATPVFAAGVTVPLSLVGACAAMWVVGYSIDNLSLMALTISVGFVIDDAIVMIENIESHRERGESRIEAALKGARQIGFTVLSISLSLVAVFIPLLFMGGVMGRLLREFAMTLTFAILISTVISLTVTPMICARLPGKAHHGETAFDRFIDGALQGLVDLYARSLRPVVDHAWLTLIVVIATIAGTVYMFEALPKGNMPQDDIGLINGSSEAAADVSFTEMSRLQRQVVDIIQADPAVANLGSFLGASNLTASTNQGRLFIALKPMAERKVSSMEVIHRLRKQFDAITGVSVTLKPSQDLRGGGRDSKALYQFSVSDMDLDELEEWHDKILQRVSKLPELADVSSDRQAGGLKASVVVDRNAASRMGVSMTAIDAALNSAFGQRQDSIIYTQRNQYRVIVEVPPSRQQDLRDLSSIYVSTGTGAQIPLTAVAQLKRGYMPLVVNHQGALPSATITFNVGPGSNLEAATNAITAAVDELQLPGSVRTGFMGEAADLKKLSGGMTILMIASLLSVYIILGILYESLLHPITIISTLPSAGLGALLALWMFGAEFTMIALIGILLLIGIVKKNGIMLVDFALYAERELGLSPHDAALLAARERFRPILMTTLAAMFGALPLAFATGIGAELRRPLGITIVGGLLLSQALTLYTTPVIYLLMNKLRDWRKFSIGKWFASRRAPPAQPPTIHPAPKAPPAREVNAPAAASPAATPLYSAARGAVLQDAASSARTTPASSAS